MDQPIDNYWRLRLADLKTALESNNFDVYLADDRQAACRIVLEDIIPKLNAKSVSWGGSMTVQVATGLYERLKDHPDLDVLDTYDKKLSDEQKQELRRQALLADLFITGTNAITESGQLVNLDMIGNRIGALTFGPRYVVILAGRNKLAANLDEAMYRVKNYVAPANSMRLDKKTPCTKTSYCEECKSPDRICNTWTITEKSFPKKRVKVVLINEDLGL
jgi:L-lactate utilization protein LutB